MNCEAFLAEFKFASLQNYCKKLLSSEMAFNKLRLQIFNFCGNHDSAAFSTVL